MYAEEVCRKRDEELLEIQAATVRTLQEANTRTFDQALTIAWSKGWAACLEAHELIGTVINDGEAIEPK
jgi:hypothetical protein